MKKVIIAIILIFCFIPLISFAGCNDSEQLQIYVPDGAPSLAIAGIINSGAIGGYKANVAISTGEDVVAKCSSGQADVAIVPTNAAVKICANRDDYQLFTVNVWGLLYVVGWSEAASLSELKGKTLASIGMGNTGEYLFKRILDINNVGYSDSDGVQIDYVDDGTTAIGMLMQGKCEFALLGEPAATNAINKAALNGKTLYRVFDLQSLWQNVTSSETSGYPQASVIVKRNLLIKNGFADELYRALLQNNAFLADNTDKLGDILKAAGSFISVNYTADIIERCNLNVLKACDVKQDIFRYLEQFGAQFTQMLKDDLYYEFNS